MRNLLIIFGCLLLFSCSKGSIKEHVEAAPSDQGCGHCHYLIYKEWKITFKPYEQVPVPGSTVEPGLFPQYHDRKEGSERPKTTITPAGKDCSECHVKSETPTGACSRERGGDK